MGWFWFIVCVVAVVIAYVVFSMMIAGASVLFVENDCYRVSIERSLTVSESDAPNTDWQAYYREVAAVCQITEEPSADAKRLMLEPINNLQGPQDE